MTKLSVRLPGLNLAETILVYHTCSEIGNAELLRMYGSLCGKTMKKIRDYIKAYQRENAIIVSVGGCFAVDKKVAFAALGLDIETLENSYKRLQKFNLIPAISERASE